MKKITSLVALFLTLSIFAQVEITYTPDDTITAGVLCDNSAPGDVTAIYSYFLSDFGVDPSVDFTISEVRFGASALVGAPAEGLVATVNIFISNTPFPTSNLTLIESQEFAMLPGTDNTLYEVPFNATVPGDSEIVLEVQFPNDGMTIAGIGTNEVGNGVSWVLGCGGVLPIPTDLEIFELGADWVLEATGDSALSLGDSLLAANVSLFPNPTNGDLNLNLNRNLGNLSVNIVNVSGQVVMNKTIDGVGTSTLETSKLSNGVYFAQISSQEGNTTIKFIKN